MTTAIQEIQVGEPARVRVHALERRHTHGPSRLTDFDLTGTSAHVVRVTSPTGVSIDLSATVDDEPGGLFGGDLAPDAADEVGSWRVQGRFVKDGLVRRTTIGTLEVTENLPDPP